MTHKISILLLCFAVLFLCKMSNVSADDLFTESFEGGVGEWQIDNGVWEVGESTSGPGNCYSGTQCAATVLGGNYDGNSDSHLVSPILQLPPIEDDQELHLRFWHWFSYSSYDSGSVQVSVFDETSEAWGTWVSVGSTYTGVSVKWTPNEVDLTTYAGKRIKLGFLHTAGRNSFGDPSESSGWYIDDLQVETRDVLPASPPFNEGFEGGWGNWHTNHGIWEIGTPTTGPGNCHSGAQCAATVLDGNYNGYTDSHLVSPILQLPSIEDDQELHLRFWHWFSYSSYDTGSVQVSVFDETSEAWGTWVSVGSTYTGVSVKWTPNEVDLTTYAGKRIKLGFLHTAGRNSFGDPSESSGWYIDDLQVETRDVLPASPPFNEGFEGGWGNWHASQGIWEIGTPTTGPGKCYTGTQCAATVLGGNYDGYTHSRLVSPMLELPTIGVQQELHLRFWHWFRYSSYDSGKLQVSVYDEATVSWGDWLDVGSAYGRNSLVWTPAEEDLTKYAGRKVRIGFYHTAGRNSFGDASESTGWYIDDLQVEIRAVLPPSPPFNEGFEGGWGNWHASQGIWEIGTPTTGPGKCYTGTQCAATVLGGNYDGYTHSRLVSPMLELPTIGVQQELHLRFWHWFRYSSYDSGKVQVSVYDEATVNWGDWLDVGSAYGGNSLVWTPAEEDLTKYAGRKVRIGFYHTAGRNSFGDASESTGWYIDDLVVQARDIIPASPPFNEGFESGWGSWSVRQGIWEIGTPTTGPGKCYTGTQCAATVLGGNYDGYTHSRLVSPMLELPTIGAQQELHLRFWHWFRYLSYDSGKVQVSVYDEATVSWEDWLDVGSAYGGNSLAWTPAEEDLTKYAGRKVRIGFYHTAGRNSFGDASESTGWYIDDIQLLAVTNTDLDGDGLPNDWETTHGLDPNNPDDAGFDEDNDGLSNFGEFDNDTDPNNADSDGDTLPDGWEVQYGLDPLDNGSSNPMNGCNGDLDEDGLSNCQEYYFDLDPTIEEQGQIGVSPDSQTVSIGGYKQYELTVANATAKADTFTLTVEGLDPAWYTLTENEFLLVAGEERTIQLAIHIPEDCGIEARDYPFTVRIASANGLPTASMDADLTVVRDPLLSLITPQNSEAMGANQLLFAWQSDAPGSSQVFYRKIGDVEYNSASDAPGTEHAITLESLAWNTTYEWYVQTQTLCGSSTGEVRQNRIESGVMFENAPYEFTIERDYDQIRTLRVRNTDLYPHEVLLTIENSNAELIAGFRGDGSMDQTITLQPDEVREVEVAFHAQDAKQTDYAVKFKLLSDAETLHPIISYAKAQVMVRQPNFALVLQEIDNDPATLTNTFRLTNNGDPITDVTVTAADGSRPALFFDPMIDHYRMAAGESIEFRVLADRVVTATIIAKGAGEQVTLETRFGCEAGAQVYKVPIQNPKLCIKVRGSYCTNRPNLNIPFYLPEGLQLTDVSSAASITNFSLNPRWSYRPHDVNVFINRNPVFSLYNSIPQGRYANAFPPSYLHYALEGAAGNAIQVNTRHLNGGHYVVASNFTVALELKEPLIMTVCATSEAQAQTIAAQKAATLLCDEQWDTCPGVVSFRTLDPTTGVTKSQFYKGDSIKFEVGVLNPDSVERKMRLELMMDDDPQDAVAPVVNIQYVTVPAYGSATKSFIAATPDRLPDGKIRIGVRLVDDTCDKSTQYVYSFNLGLAPPPTAWITDGGYYSTNNTSIFADWGGQGNGSAIAYYLYRIGTAVCAGDVQDWAQSAVAGPRDIPTTLRYGGTYYVCIKAVNTYGVESSAVSTDGIVVLDPQADPDSDNFISQDEIAAKSDPLNEHSMPGTSVLNLRKGFNLVSFPAEVYAYGNFANLLEDIGGPEVIEEVLLFNPSNDTFARSGYDAGGRFFGPNANLAPGTGMDGMIIYAKQDYNAIFTSMYCRNWTVQPGVNLIGSGCAASDFTAFDLLGGMNVDSRQISIQRFNPLSGGFETAHLRGDSTPTGNDFAIRPGEGYFVHLAH